MELFTSHLSTAQSRIRQAVGVVAVAGLIVTAGLTLSCTCTPASCRASDSAQIALAATGQSLSAAELIPLADESVAREGELMIYAGEALYDYINGGAPQYIEYGFVEVATQELTYQEHTYIFDVYRMSDPLAAFGIYSVRRPRGGLPLGGFPYSSYASYQGMLAHGAYLIEIASYESTPETAAEMAELAALGTAGLSPGGAPDDLTLNPPFTDLPVAGRIPGTERLARGPISLRSALAAAGSGPFLDALEAAAEASRGDESASASSGGEAGPVSPTWVIADYHPEEPAEGTPAGATVAALLLAAPSETAEGGGLATGRLLTATEEAVRTAGSPVEMPGGTGWILLSDDGPQMGAVPRGRNLLLCRSRLMPQVFRMWLAEVASEGR